MKNLGKKLMFWSGMAGAGLGATACPTARGRAFIDYVGYQATGAVIENAIAGELNPASQPMEINVNVQGSEGVKESSNDFNELALLGLRQYNKGDYYSASQNLEQCLPLCKNEEERVLTLFWLGDSYRKRNELDKAYKTFYTLIGENPSHERAWVSLELLSDIEIQRGNKNNALIMLKQFDEINPRYRDINRVHQTINSLKEN